MSIEIAWIPVYLRATCRDIACPSAHVIWTPVTLNASVGWSAGLSTESFMGKSVADDFRESDAQLRSDVVADYLGQFRALAKKRSNALSFSEVVIAALK